jgi:hypothetical protein
MKTKEEIGGNFLSDLRSLLDKYNAEITAEDHYEGYPECGEDIRMTVYIPAIYDKNGNTTQEFVEINLGKYI